MPPRFGLVAELDAGPVYGVVTEPIGEQDTAGDLLARIAESGASLLVATLDGIEAGQLEPRPQPAEGDQLCPQADPRRRAGALEGPRAGGRPADPCLHPRSRCMDDARGDPAEAMAGAAMPTSGRGQRADVPGSLTPGELRAGGAGVFAGTATRPVVLGQDVQPPGKRRMAAAEWARGLHLDQAGAGQPPPGLHLTMARGPAAGRGRSVARMRATSPASAPTSPASGPTRRPPAPTSPVPAPTRRPPAPTSPVPAPTRQPAGPTSPVPAPTRRPPARTRPPPAPTRPPPAPTRPPPAPTSLPPAPVPPGGRARASARPPGATGAARAAPPGGVSTRPGWWPSRSCARCASVTRTGTCSCPRCCASAG